MKKFLLIALILIVSVPEVLADSYMPLPDAVNSRMFSTEGSRPMLNLERTYYDNQAIRKIEEKNSYKNKVEQNKEQPVSDIEEEHKTKTKFKDLFKGFVIEY